MTTGLDYNTNDLNCTLPTCLLFKVPAGSQLIVPSKKLIIVRMGEAPVNALVPISFHNDLWVKLNAVIP